MVPEHGRAVSNSSMRLRHYKQQMSALAVCILLGNAAFSQSGQKVQNNPCPVEDKTVPKPIHGMTAPIKLRLLKYVAPDYPPLAHRARVQGAVVIQARVADTGEVENSQLVSGHPLLAPAALAAVRRWRYEPACLKGVHVAVDYQIKVNFSLKDGVTVE